MAPVNVVNKNRPLPVKINEKEFSDYKNFTATNRHDLYCCSYIEGRIHKSSDLHFTA
jgi:hypothetical protein